MLQERLAVKCAVADFQRAIATVADDMQRIDFATTGLNQLSDNIDRVLVLTDHDQFSMIVHAFGQRINIIDAIVKHDDRPRSNFRRLNVCL